jgi:hypothetical protein
MHCLGTSFCRLIPRREPGSHSSLLVRRSTSWRQCPRLRRTTLHRQSVTSTRSLQQSNNRTCYTDFIAFKWAVDQPGHWPVQILDMLADRYRWSAPRTERATAILFTAMYDATLGTWYDKYHFMRPRPAHLEPNIAGGYFNARASFLPCWTWRDHCCRRCSSASLLSAGRERIRWDG